MNFVVCISELFNKELYINAFISIKNVVMGFSIAFIVSMILALLIFESKILRKFLYPIIELLRPIPNAGWVPITIILCDTIELSILFITFIGAFFPMFLNIYRSFLGIPKNYLMISKLYKLRHMDRIIKVLIPAIMPGVFTSLMLGISGSWASVIMAEMISGKEGLGYYTWKAYTLLNYEQVFIGIFFMGLMGALVSFIISKTSKKVLFWVRSAD